MSLELTPDQRQAVLANSGSPIYIHDSTSRKVFLLIEQGAEPLLDEEYIDSGLNLARKQIASGEVGTRTFDDLITEARRRSKL
jgi:hypothetical protein